MKMCHFILCCKTSDATHMAHLFFNEIVRLYGLLSSIISNKDTRFIGNFWRTFSEKLGTKLNFNLAYHTQSNGKTELVDKILENILRNLVGDNTKKWDHVLAKDEITYNDSPNRSTRRSLFQILCGIHPRGVSELIYLGKL